jgi:hypothetical protein
MVQEATKFDTLSSEEFVSFFEGIGKITADGRLVKASRPGFITGFIRAFHSANENLLCGCRLWHAWRWS